jgi:hypothetical protein
MRITDRIFSAPSTVGKPLVDPQRQASHDVGSIKTYRYLRLGMLAAVAALSYSILEERNAGGVHCFLGSISAYYYTPVHSMFVGVMVAIGVALIVIKGRTVIEDTLLSLAGVMAPIVAFVPTSDPTGDKCRAAMETAGHYLPPATDARNAANAISNNLHAYLFAGSVIVGLLVIVAAFAQRRISKRSDAVTPMDGYMKGTAWSLAGAVVLLGVGWTVLLTEYSWLLQAHGKAAVAMFFFLAGAAIANGVLGLTKQHTGPGYAWTYLSVGVAMLGCGVAFIVVQLSDSSAFRGHLVLFIEVVELALFAAFWALQTRERWNETV